MKNKLMDLNNHLFAQLERLSDEDLDTEQLAVELDRSKAIRIKTKCSGSFKASSEDL